MKIKLTAYLDGTEKLQELILHIARASEGDERFGLVKLNKLLFYSDFAYYLKTGMSISGTQYWKLQHGPVPRIMPGVLQYLEKHQRLAVADRDYHGRVQKRPMALREPNLTRFTADEIAFVDHVIKSFWQMNASEISDASHEFAGWKYADMRENIPYESALLSRPTIVTNADHQAIDQIDADEARLLLAA